MEMFPLKYLKIAGLVPRQNALVGFFDAAEFERVEVMSFYIGNLRFASILGSVD